MKGAVKTVTGYKSGNADEPTVVNSFAPFNQRYIQINDYTNKQGSAGYIVKDFTSTKVATFTLSVLFNLTMNDIKS